MQVIPELRCFVEKFKLDGERERWAAMLLLIGIIACGRLDGGAKDGLQLTEGHSVTSLLLLL